MTYLDRALIFSIDGAKAPVENVDSNPLRFRKHLAKKGHYRTADGIEFDIDDGLLDHWKKTFDEMLADKERVLGQLEHTDDPEKTRATYLRFERTEDGLFGIGDFRDEAAKTDLINSDVSIYVPPHYTNGTGKTYHRPITHVAFTNRPVITGLGKFEAIAASLVKDPPMPSALQALAKKLGVKINDNDDDTKVETAITGAWKMSMATLAQSMGLQVQEGADEAAIEQQILAAWNELKGGGQGGGQGGPPPAVAASLTSILRDNRTRKIDDLVESGHIVPAVADRLKKRFVDEKALALSLSTPKFNDGFDEVIADYAANDPVVSFNEKTRGQTVALSKDGGGAYKRGSLAEKAKARREAAKR